MKAVTLQRAGPSDLDALRPFVESYHAFEGIALAAADRDRALRTLLADDQAGCVWFVREENARIGYAAICFGFSIEFGGRDAFLDELWLEPGARGRGIGSRVVARLCELAADHGVHALHLEVALDNARARATYEAQGFALRAGFQLMSRRLTPGA